MYSLENQKSVKDPVFESSISRLTADIGHLGLCVIDVSVQHETK